MAEEIRLQLIKEMVEAGIVTRQGETCHIYKHGREYLLLMSVVDITDWKQREDSDD